MARIDSYRAVVVIDRRAPFLESLISPGTDGLGTKVFSVESYHLVQIYDGASKPSQRDISRRSTVIGRRVVWIVLDRLSECQGHLIKLLCRPVIKGDWSACQKTRRRCCGSGERRDRCRSVLDTVGCAANVAVTEIEMRCRRVRGSGTRR